EGLNHYATGNGRDGRNPLRCLHCQTVAHHGAVRHSSGIYAGVIHWSPGGEVGQQREHKADVVNRVGTGVTAASAGVPGQQSAADAPRTIRVNGEKSFTVRARIEPGPLLLPFRRASAAMKVYHYGKRLLVSRLRWDMEEIRANAPSVCETEVIITWGEVPGI